MFRGDRLKELRLNQKITQKQLGTMLNQTSHTTVNYYEKNKANPSAEVLQKLARIFNTSTDYLLGNTDDPTPHAIHQIPILGTIACGIPILAEENIDYYISDPRLEADFGLVCHGDSMIDAHIYDGDIVFIKKDTEVTSGNIAAIMIDDEATLKRFYRISDNTIELRPENSRYSPLIFSGEEIKRVTIIGKAIAVQSKII